MKTTLFYVALFIGSLVAFNAHAYDRLYYNDAIEYVERQKLLNMLDDEEAEYCNNIIGVGQEAILMRDEGHNQVFVLEDLENSRKALEFEAGARMRQDVYIEMSRMVYTVFRYPNMDVEEYNQQFFAECIALGGY